MPRTLRKALLGIAALTLGLFALTGCNGSFQGLGQMRSVTPGASPATLLFKVLCNPDTQTVSGQLIYSDPGPRVSIQANANSAGLVSGPWGTEPATCDNDPTQGHYLGTFTGSISGARVTGSMQVDLTVPGGCPGGAYVDIALHSGTRNYSNSGCLVKGQVQPIIIGTATPSSFPSLPPL